MSSKCSILLTATALSLSVGLVHATGFPSSSNETGPVQIESSRAASAAGATHEPAPSATVEFRGAAGYEVRTPSSSDESAPGQLDRRTVPAVRAR
jgi:hypothetical protein